MSQLRIALAQLNVLVGDLAGNAGRIREALGRALAWRADLVVFPELAVTGYPPEDLLLKRAFVDDNLEALRELARSVRGTTALVGFVDRDPAGRLFDAAAVLADGRHRGTYRKQCLPNYGVFDEKRYFQPGREPVALRIAGAPIGITICEDLWEGWPVRDLARQGCSLVVNLSASPYHAGKALVRQRLFGERARQHRVAIAYCNLVGGQDELVFDGASLVLDARGRCVARGYQFRDDLILADLDVRATRLNARGRGVVIEAARQAIAHPPWPATRRPLLPPREEIYDALVLGTRDYVRKNRFDTVVLGLSGGIDSSLTACIAVDALGPERVVGVVMPSRFSSAETQADARALAKALGIRHEELPIEACFAAYLETLQPLFSDRPSDVAEQNLQARIRGNLLMALSNKFGWLVLTTGNKSEMATGYCTLYGDMAGGFAVIKDVPKTLVYELSRLRNARQRGRPIPARVFTRAPTAELAPNQTDQDTLPPYALLDQILRAYVEEDRSVQQIVQQLGGQEQTVQRVIAMVDHAEYKRRQAPPGVKITPRAFGKDRRMPVTNRYQQA